MLLRIIFSSVATSMLGGDDVGERAVPTEGDSQREQIDQEEMKRQHFYVLDYHKPEYICEREDASQ